MRFFARSAFEYIRQQVEQQAADKGNGGRLMFMMPSLPPDVRAGNRQPTGWLLHRTPQHLSAADQSRSALGRRMEEIDQPRPLRGRGEGLQERLVRCDWKPDRLPQPDVGRRFHDDRAADRGGPRDRRLGHGRFPPLRSADDLGAGVGQQFRQVDPRGLGSGGGGIRRRHGAKLRRGAAAPGRTGRGRCPADQHAPARPRFLGGPGRQGRGKRPADQSRPIQPA